MSERSRLKSRETQATLPFDNSRRTAGHDVYAVRQRVFNEWRPYPTAPEV